MQKQDLRQATPEAPTPGATGARSPKQATLYRMATPEHTCPFGLKARALLLQNGLEVDDRVLTSRAAADAFKAEHGVATTPQAFIAGERVGGYEDLQRFFGRTAADADRVTYRPVIAVFTVAALMALAASWRANEALLTLSGAELFIAFSMCILAMLKLQDVESFSTMFLGYDLLAQRYVPYAYVYPYAELAAGVLMAAGALTWASVPIALFIGTIGAASVIKAVYIDKRELRCACIGGSSKAPLGFVSLTENLMMVGMAIWMVVSPH